MLWNEYPKKESAPADTDELIQLETESGTNKTIKLSYFFDWILSKMRKQTLTLNTTNKTIEGAINEVKTTADSAKTGLNGKVNGKNITFSVSKTGSLQVTYDDGKE